MGRRAIAQLTFAAGLLWPLLAVAGMQALALLTLKTALGSARSLGGGTAERADVAAVASLPAAVTAPAAAAA